MTFLEPNLLYASLAGVIVIALGIRQWRRRVAFRKAFSQRVEGMAGVKPMWAEGLEIVLTACAMVCMAIALAGPKSDPSSNQSGQRTGMDIVIVADTSRSMLALDHGTSRMERVRRELQSLLLEMGGDRVGLVGFAGEAKMFFPLTEDFSSLSFFADRLEVDATLGEGSALARGIDKALELLPEDETGRARCMVLLSDGEELQSAEAALESTAKARGEGVRVFTVMFGQPKGAAIPLGEGLGDLKDEQGRPVLSRSDPELLQRIAAEGEGAFVADGEVAFPLGYLYKRHLAPLARGPIEKEGEAGTIGADYQWILLAGLVLLVCSLFHPFRLRPRRATIVCLIVLCLPLTARAGDEAVEAAKKGIDFYKAGRFAEACDGFAKAREGMPDDPRIAVNLGLALYKTGSFDRAMTCFEVAMDSKETPVSQAARFAAGLCSFEMAAYALALAEQVDPHEAMEPLLDGMKRLNASQAFFEQSIKDSAWEQEALANLATASDLLDAMKTKLAQVKEKLSDATDSKTGSDGSGDATDPGEGGLSGRVDGNKDDAIDKEPGFGREGADPAEERRGNLKRGVRRVLTAEERDEIFVHLRDMEQKRMALEKEALMARRRQARGENR